MMSAALMAAACGAREGAPTGPSNTGSGAATAPTGPGASPGATITGNIQNAAPSATVGVAGSSMTAALDPAGHFTLAGVPAGDVQLQVNSGAAQAAVAIPGVQVAQTVEVVVMVSGASASLESEVRHGVGEAELKGFVEALPPATQPLTFKAAGKTVTTSASTVFASGGRPRTFADLKLRSRVEIKGSLSGDAFTATRVEIEDAAAPAPTPTPPSPAPTPPAPTPAPKPEPVEAELNGAISALSGTASSFQFNIDSRTVKGDAATTFFGDGDKPDTFADLKNGARVEVKGQQRDNFVYATRIHINGTEKTPPEDTSASIHGVLKSVSGAKPTLLLVVDLTTVRTTSGTEVKRRGDVQTLDALKIGQSLHVIGARQSDGSINARLIEIEDDAAGAEFEIEGSLGGLKGTCPSVAFGVNGFSITTAASTTFEGATCQALKSGDKVTVKGTRQGDGSVAATRVTKK